MEKSIRPERRQKVTKSVNLPYYLWQSLKQEAKENDTSVSERMRKIVDAYFEAKDNGEDK